MSIKKNDGFTITELIVVIGIATILLVLVLSNLNRNRIQARDRIRIADIQTIRLALEEYKAACGVFPATLDLTENNGRHGVCSSTLGDFLAEIPINPPYSKGNNQYFENYPNLDPSEYMYYGVSHILNGPCFDYIIGTQLEWGSGNDFGDNESDNFFAEVDQESLVPNTSHKYRFRCEGSVGDGIEDADDPTYGIYGFRSLNTSDY